MDTFTYNDPNWGNLINTDSDRIINGQDKQPERIDGIRTYTDGERCILHWYYTSHIKPFLDKIKEAKTRMEIATKQGLYLLKLQDVLTAKQKDEEKKLKVKTEQLDNEIQEEKNKLPSTLQHNQEKRQAKAEKKENTKQNFKKIMTFMLVGFLIEALAFIATKSFQNETLGWDVITTRLLFLLGIYLESAYLYVKYIKTRNKVAKAFVALSILASAACLMHVIAAAVINDVTAVSENLYFGLEQLTSETESEETSTGLITKLLAQPGLIEFLFSSLLCFCEIIITLDVTPSKKGIRSNPTTNEEAISQGPNYDQLGIKMTLEHIESLTREKDEIRQKAQQDKERLAKQIDRIKEMLKATENQQNEASKELDKNLTDFESSTFLVWEKINGHDRLLQKEYAFRSKGKTTQKLVLEPVTQKDIETYYLSKHNNQ